MVLLRALVIALVVTIAAPAWAGDVVDRIVAVVNRDIILKSELDQTYLMVKEEALRGTPVGERDEAEAQLQIDVLEGLIANKLMEQAMDLGMAGAASELGETDVAAMGAMMETIMDAVSFEATGKVTGVEDGMATIEYEITVSMEIDDLVGMAAEIAPEAGEIPPGVEASLLAGVELTGTGMFDLELGQLVSLELEGDMSMEMDGAADMQGTSAEAAAAMSGTTTTKMTVEVQ